MHNDKLSFLDCLPVRPLPETMESFCSYLMRTGNLNQVNNLARWRRILNLKFCYCGQNTRDNPPLNFGSMARQLDCQSEQLLATTFHYLGEKFLCDRKQTIKLVVGIAADHLRYCPRCVEEKGYYQLTWRFQFIPGCVEHQCYLQTVCPHCDKRLPLISKSMEIALCQHCGGPLTDCHKRPLSTQDARITQVRAADMNYLLQPQSHLYRLPFSEKLARLRQLFGISLEEIARLRGWRKSAIYQFEHRSTTSTLEHYMHYADYLGLSLREVLAYREHALILPTDEVRQIRSACADARQQKLAEVDHYEEALLHRVKQAVTTLRAQGESDGQVAIARYIGTQPDEMITHPRVKQYLDQVAQQRIERRIQHLSQAIPEAIAQLDALQLPPSKNRIRKLVGFNLAHYRRKSEPVDALVTPAIQRASGYVQVRDSQTGVLGYQHLDDVTTRIEQILAEAEKEDRYLKQIQIATMVGVCADTLRAHAHIRDMLREHEQKRVRHLCAERLQAIETAAHQLRSQNQKITAASLGRLIGIRPSQLVRCPTLWERVTTLRQQDHEKREADLLAAVKNAEQQLRSEQHTVTLSALGRIVQLDPNSLKRRPRVLDYLRSLPEFKLLLHY